MDEKLCPKCNQIKPTTEFHKNACKPDGLQNHCKSCRSSTPRGIRGISNKELRQEAIDLARQGLKRCCRCKSVRPFEHFSKSSQSYDGLGFQCKYCDQIVNQRVNWSIPESSKSRRKAYQQYRKKEYPEISKAHLEVNKAIKRGDMLAASDCACMACGAQAKEYHHHNGYDKEYWLDVIPLCVSCHRLIERNSPIMSSSDS